MRFKGEYQESAEVGREAIKALPRDRDVVVYLGYDLLHLEKYDELLELTSKYLDVFPKDPDIPLLEGYVHKHQGLPEQARQDFTEALDRDPEVVTAYVNRGYMLNDLHQPEAAAADFESALKREPNDGEAQLGLAYADLDLHKPEAALRQTELAERTLGDCRDIHVIRATAYGRQNMLSKSASEYLAALKFTPDDGSLHLGLGNALFAERRYHDAIDELANSDRMIPPIPPKSMHCLRAPMRICKIGTRHCNTCRWQSNLQNQCPLRQTIWNRDRARYSSPPGRRSALWVTRRPQWSAFGKLSHRRIAIA